MLGPLLRAAWIKAATRRSRAAPEVNTMCHGWVLEFKGARTARASASSNNSRGTRSCGKNIGVELRSLITCSRSNMRAS
jgi:hypothetical protein